MITFHISILVLYHKDLGVSYHTTPISELQSGFWAHIISKKDFETNIYVIGKKYTNTCLEPMYHKKSCINHAFLYYITIFFEMRLTWGNKFNKVLCLLYNYLNRCLINWAHWKYFSCSLFFAPLTPPTFLNGARNRI